MSRAFLPLLAALLTAMTPLSARSAETAYVVIENEDPDLTQAILDRIRLSLTAEASERLAAQGQFDATPRLMVRFRGDCESEAGFVAEVEEAVRGIGDMNIECRARLP